MIPQKQVTPKVKSKFPILFMLFSLSAPCFGESSENLVIRDGLYYKKFSDLPFSGKVKEIRPQQTQEGNQPSKQVDGVHIEAEYKNGRLDGQYTSYHENGQLSRKGHYQSGKKVGEWHYYYSNGQLSMKGNYQAGERIGIWDYYWIKGNLYSRGEHTPGTDGSHGYWLDCEIDGQTRSITSGTYQNGQKISRAYPNDWKCR